jgi:long-chain acyl-CoA synthetase
VERHPRHRYYLFNQHNLWKPVLGQEIIDDVFLALEKLKEINLKPGHRVFLCAESSQLWVATVLAVNFMGATVIPVDHSLSENFLSGMINVSMPHMFFVDRQTENKMAKVLGPSRIILNIQKNWQPIQPHQKIQDVDSLAEPDIAVMMFGSGTTGISNLVKVGHDNMINFYKNKDADSKFNLILSVLPWTHIYGLMTSCMKTLTNNYTMIIPKSVTAEDLQDAFALKPDMFVTVPRLLEMIYSKAMLEIKSKTKKEDRVKLAISVLGHLYQYTRFPVGKLLLGKIRSVMGGNIKEIVSGGSTLPSHIAAFFHAAGMTVREGYGLTESTGAVTYNFGYLTHWGSVGKKIRASEVQIVHPESTGEGEIWVKSPQVTHGYFNDPVSTSRVFVSGWLNTGDVGFLDDHGYLFITGRTKEVIVTRGGLKVFPAQIEEKLLHIPGIKNLTVFGLPQKLVTGDLICAAVVADHNFSQDEIKKAIFAVKTPDLPHVERVMFIEQLPMTMIGKVQRFKLVAIAKERNIAEESVHNEVEDPRFQKSIPHGKHFFEISDIFS